MVGVARVMYMLRMAENDLWEHFQAKETEMMVRLKPIEAENDHWKCGG